MTRGQSTGIEVSGLTKTFGNLYALQDLNFAIEKGEFLTMFGPNGAGKTTLIKVLATLTKASSGKIKIAGISFEHDMKKIRAQIGMIAHQTFLYENLTAEENLRFYGKLYSVQNLGKKIDELLSLVGLKKRKNDFVRTFSRGMQQRLTIARAMIHDPAILLLDEPYTGLDQHASEMLTTWLRQLHGQDRTTLMVTHDIEHGMELADRVAILVSGKLVSEQKCSQLKPGEFRQKYYDLVQKGTQS